MGIFVRYAVLIPGVFFAVQCSWAAGEPSIQEDIAEHLTEAVTSWMDSLQSFKGEYRLDQLKDGRTTTWNIEYRWQAGNRFLSYPLEDDDGNSRLSVHSYLAGIWSNGLSYDEKTHVDLDAGGHWPFPENVFFMPEEWFNPSYNGIALKDIVNQASKVSYIRNGIYILSCRFPIGPMPNADIWLDSEKRVMRIDFVHRFGAVTEEESKQFYDGDSLDAREVEQSIEYFNYIKTSNIEFPLSVIQTVYSDTPLRESLNKAFEEKSISMKAYTTGMFEASRDRGIFLERRAEVYPETLLVNARLDNSAFRIPYGPGDTVAYGRVSNEVLEIKPWYYRAGVIFIISLTLLSIGFVVWRIWKDRFALAR